MSILGMGMFIVQPQLNYTVELQVEMNGRNSVSWKLGELSMKKNHCHKVYSCKQHRAASVKQSPFLCCVFLMFVFSIN